MVAFIPCNFFLKLGTSLCDFTFTLSWFVYSYAEDSWAV